jgi:HPt (histidine-containing phosphotransfer) domain-containing protein
MDDYLSKPINSRELFAAVGLLVPAPSPPADCGSRNIENQRASTQNPAIHVDRILEQLEGDRELMVELAKAFLDDYPTLLAAVRDAIGTGDSPALERSAHKLKGSVAIFAAHTAAQAALRLEKLGADGEMMLAGETLSALEQELERVVAALETL